MKPLRLVLPVVLVWLAAATPAFAQSAAQTPTEICKGATPAKDPATRQYDKPEQVLKPNVDYRAVLCTDAGPIYVDLFEDYTPITVNSFVFLARNGFFNNTTFHRVIADFMAQGGDPTGTGSGGPGYEFKNEPVGFLHFDIPGWLAMANAGPDTNGSQFFITTAAASHLDYQYTIFGEVLEGQDNAAKIRLRDPQIDTQPGTSLNTVVIIDDPVAVMTTYKAPLPPTEADVVKDLDSIKDLLPTDGSITVDTAGTGALTTDQTAATAPEADQKDFGDFLAKYNHQYRVSAGLANAKCDLQTTPFMTLHYSVDAFDTSGDAADALADGFLDKLAKDEGLTGASSQNLPNTLYTATTTACDVSAVKALTYWERGQFVVTAEITIPTEGKNLADRYLAEVVGMQIYERALSDVLRREIRLS